MCAQTTRARVALSLSGLVGGAVVILPAASGLSCRRAAHRWTPRPSSAAQGGWASSRSTSLASSPARRRPSRPAPVEHTALGSLALATGPGTPGTPNRAGKIYLTETFPGSGIDPTRLTALNYRTESRSLPRMASSSSMTRPAAAGHQYQNLVWTPGNVAGTPAITPGTCQDWDTSTGGGLARYNVGGLTAGTAYQLTDAEATAKATDPALLATVCRSSMRRHELRRSVREHDRVRRRGSALG